MQSKILFKEFTHCKCTFIAETVKRQVQMGQALVYLISKTKKTSYTPIGLLSAERID